MPTIREIGDEEAKLAVEAIAAELKRRGKAATVAVADAHGELVALLRLDGAGSFHHQRRRQQGLHRRAERKPSGTIGDSIRADGWDISFLGDPRYIGWQGGLPVVIAGQVAGAVAVSGLTGEEDAELAALGIKRITESAKA